MLARKDINMYRQNCVVKIENVPKDEPIDLYIMKRGASLVAAAVTSTTYQTARIEVQSGIRDVEDFTRLCTNHEFELIKESPRSKIYNLEFTLDMCDTFCTIDEYPSVLSALPEQLVNCLAG